LRKIVIFLCLFWMGFIFYMSSNNGEISHQESNKIVNLIENKTKNENFEANKSIIKEQQMKEKRLDYLVRKNAHAFMYMVLALLVSSVFFMYNKMGKNTIVYILFICLFYAVTDEFHQSFVPERTSVVSDVLVDLGGALIGLMFFCLTYYKIYGIYVIKKKFKLLFKNL